MLPSTDFNNSGYVASCSIMCKAHVRAQPQRGHASPGEAMDGRTGTGSFREALLCNTDYPAQHIRVLHGSVPVCRAQLRALLPFTSASTGPPRAASAC